MSCVSLKTGETVPIPEQAVLCLGNFDGVHLAHRALLREAVRRRDLELPSASVGVFCFRELPAQYLSTSFEGKLCDNEERMARYAECGIEFVVWADFLELRGLSAEQYVSDVLIDVCHAAAVCCGFNHRFGQGGKGDAVLLERIFGARLWLQSEIVIDGATVSSSRIRTLLKEGKPEIALQLLGTPYAIKSTVLHGKALGRQMGTPTVNQRFPTDFMIPRHGVYVTECSVGGQTYRGVSNIGYRPTVDSDGEVNCETYLLDFEGDLYGQSMTVRFLRYLRAERRFKDIETLKKQIQKDIDAARM
ncbi:MAG: riboflavin biosynthesis protein RibF [Clostridia bacterium]|nr:riboflavin biosynthesis protein RibF [Clostridia bacterium]